MGLTTDTYLDAVAGTNLTAVREAEDAAANTACERDEEAEDSTMGEAAAITEHFILVLAVGNARAEAGLEACSPKGWIEINTSLWTLKMQ